MNQNSVGVRNMLLYFVWTGHNCIFTLTNPNMETEPNFEVMFIGGYKR